MDMLFIQDKDFNVIRYGIIFVSSWNWRISRTDIMCLLDVPSSIIDKFALLNGNLCSWTDLGSSSYSVYHRHFQFHGHNFSFDGPTQTSSSLDSGHWMPWKAWYSERFLCSSLKYVDCPVITVWRIWVNGMKGSVNLKWYGGDHNLNSGPAENPMHAYVLSSQFREVGG